MNKVFKVIWSEARNAYVVVSEMAKSHGTKSCSTKKLLAMLIATGVMTCASVAPVMAKNLTDTKTKPEMIGYEQKWDTDVAKGILGTSIKAYQYKGNSLQLNMLKFEKYTTAKGENALAIRLGANIDGVNKSGNIYLVDKNTKNQTLTTTINGSVIKTVLTDTDDNKVESSVDISKYVKNEVNKAKTEVKAGKNVTVTSEIGANGNTIYTVNADAAVVYAKNGSLHSTNSSSVVGEQSVVLGKNAASAAEAVAIGDNAKVNGRKGVAVGIGSESSSAGWATAIGSDAKATGGYSVALGNGAEAKELKTIAIGNNSSSSGGSSIAVGTEANASGAASIAISQGANASGQHSMAFGISSKASGGHTIAIGGSSEATATNAIAIGSQTIADKDNSVAVGPNIRHIGTGAAAVGAQANATGNYSVAMGNLVNVDADWNKNHPGEFRNSGEFSVAIGSQSGAWGAVSTSVGALSKAEGNFANAIGSYANASGNYTNAMGLYSAASADYANAMGIYSTASADYANAIGSYANASAAYSVALGSLSVADREAGMAGYDPVTGDKSADESSVWKANAGAVSVGSSADGEEITRQITNVAAGTYDTDAVNVAQLKNTNQRIDGVENQVISNTNRINKLGSRVNKVGAGAAALAALHPMDFDPDDKWSFAAGYGNYAGENAAAIGAYYRPDEKVMFSVGGTVGNGENMVNAGISFALDRTNHVSNSRTALAREVIDLRGQLAEMGAKMAKMEKAFGMLDETKTKLFPDIPANHWAYEYIAKLAGNGYIEGYPDGNFGGDRLMTRYEFAAMLYRAIENGAAMEEKIIKEFEPELGRIRVDRISGEDGDRDKIERVRVNDTKGERDHYGNKLAK